MPASPPHKAEAQRATDAALMAAVSRGDRGALGELYRRHAPALLGLACQLLRDRGDAEDVLHDVLLEAWQRARQWDPERGGVRAWLAVRVRSRALDRLRSGARRAELVRTRVDAPPGPREPANLSDCARARRAVLTLSAVQREAVELAYFEGLSATEVAAQLALPVGTVKSRLAAGLSGLRKAFQSDLETT